MDFFSVSNFLPHIILFVFGWHMTVGPGTLLLHHLKSFEILDEQIIPVGNLVVDDSFKKAPKLKLSPSEVIKVPYVRNFLFSLSMPCFATGYYFLTFLRKRQAPDCLLFVNSHLPIILTSVILIKKKPFSFLFALASILATYLTLKMEISSNNFNDMQEKYYPILYVLVFIQYFSFSNSICTITKSYYEYSHPPIIIFDFEECYSVLQMIYSGFWHFLVTVWHHVDAFTITLYTISRIFSVFEEYSNLFLIIASISTCILSLPCAKCLLQLKMVTLMLPVLKHGTKSADDKKLKKKTDDDDTNDVRNLNKDNKKKKESDELIKVVNPLGKVAFGITALYSHLYLLNVGWIYCNTFHSEYSALFASVLHFMIFTGTVLSSTARLFSLIFSIIPQNYDIAE